MRRKPRLIHHLGDKAHDPFGDLGVVPGTVPDNNHVYSEISDGFLRARFEDRRNILFQKGEKE
jgi:hypothetical protein